MSCNGSGYLDCYCGGDRCACGFPPDCPGCGECAEEAEVGGFTESGLKKLCAMYDARVAQCGGVSRKGRTFEDLDGAEMRGHLRWMLAAIPGLGDGDKVNRWIGFVQGVFAALQMYTIDELRGHVTEAKA